GFRWKVNIPIHQIKDILPITRLDKSKMLDLSLLSNPKYLITLSEPVTVNGLFGIKRTHHQLAIDADWDLEVWKERLKIINPESGE
ncbi:MAG: hypothetical protein AAFV80_24515, partial [Bacteroidota bacterium]